MFKNVIQRRFNKLCMFYSDFVALQFSLVMKSLDMVIGPPLPECCVSKSVLLDMQILLFNTI